MKNRKGQSAFEFLTTYGWAMMVILLMIGALSYYGILSPTKFLPSRCTFPADFICEDYILNGEIDKASVDMRHNFGETIVLQNATCTFRDGSTANFTPPSSEWEPKQTKTINCSNSGDNVLIRGDKEKVGVEIVYRYEPSGYDHSVEGEVFADVQ